MIDPYGHLQDHFPTVRRLREGVILRTITQAIWQAPDPGLAYYLSWDRPTYIINDGSGNRAAIAFQDDAIVGVFFDHESERSPYGDDGDYDWRRYFTGAPAHVPALAAEHALPYMLQDELVSPLPLITAACWSDGAELTGSESWPDVYTHGGHLVRIEILEPEEALAECQAEYEFTRAQADLLRALFQRKLASGPAPMVLTADEQRPAGGRGGGRSRVPGAVGRDWHQHTASGELIR
jgi:hypothetical protein